VLLGAAFRDLSAMNLMETDPARMKKTSESLRALSTIEAPGDAPRPSHGCDTARDCRVMGDCELLLERLLQVVLNRSIICTGPSHEGALARDT